MDSPRSISVALASRGVEPKSARPSLCDLDVWGELLWSNGRAVGSVSLAIIHGTCESQGDTLG